MGRAKSKSCHSHLSEGAAGIIVVNEYISISININMTTLVFSRSPWASNKYDCK